MDGSGLLRSARFATTLAVTVLCALLAACGGGGAPAPAPTVTSLEVTPTGPSAPAGTTTQLAATAIYSDGTHKDVTTDAVWSSSATAIATVGSSSNQGLVTAVTMGAATISAIYSGQTGTTNFTASAAALVSIEVATATPAVPAGIAANFTAMGIYSDNTHKDLTTQVTWTSTDTFVATIASSGRATTLFIGNTTIAASLGDISGQTTLNVTPALLVSIAVGPPGASVAKGFTQGFGATGTFTDMTTQNLTGQVSWTSSNPAVATVPASALSANGVIATTLSVGQSTITAGLGNISGSDLLTVTPATIDYFRVTPASASIMVGTTQQFTATGTYSDNSTQDVTTQVTWSSTSPGSAPISNAVGSNGLATGVAAGQAITISALIAGPSGALYATADLTVTPAILTSIAVTPSSANVFIGGKQPFTATGTYSDGTTHDLTGTATWSTSNAVASVSNIGPSNGIATGLTVGTSTITAAVGSISNSGTLSVTSTTYAYFPAGPNLTYCAIVSGGALSQCATAASGFANIVGIAFAGSTAYVSDPSRSSLLLCSLQLDGSMTTSCDSSSPSATVTVLPSPGDIAVANGQVVIAGQSGAGAPNPGALWVCTPTLSTCSKSSNLSYSPVGVAANAAYAYISDAADGLVQACPIAGSIGTCVTVASGFMFPVTLSLVGSQLYIVDETANSISVCAANSSDGTLSACASSALTFSPIGLAVSGATALVSDDSNNIYACAVSGSGALSACTKTVTGTASSFNPWQIAIH
jgi:hypothetical protein